jgi:hypothetical protein
LTDWLNLIYGQEPAGCSIIKKKTNKFIWFPVENFSDWLITGRIRLAAFFFDFELRQELAVFF